MATGIVKRHPKGCRSHEGGRCNCGAGWEAWEAADDFGELRDGVGQAQLAFVDTARNRIRTLTGAPTGARGMPRGLKTALAGGAQRM